MSKMMETKDDDWSLYLEDTVFSINTSVQATTKVTPFEMMFGRKARFPLQAEFISANECQEDRCKEERRCIYSFIHYIYQYITIIY